jgi:hypothetical protein
MRSFDPVRLGGLECDAWVAYYRRQWGKFLRAAVGMVREGFGMPWASTLQGAWLVLRANQVWAPYPDNDPDAARALMRSFYVLVARTHGETFDVDEASRREVEWWRAHREVQREHSGGMDGLIEALTDLYAHVYGVPPDTVRDAARLRAEAMQTSDEWVAKDCDPTSPLIETERDQLVSSYSSLRAAVRHGVA